MPNTIYDNNKRQDNGIDIPSDEGINNFDDSPYFDYHHLKAIENVSFTAAKHPLKEHTLTRLPSLKTA